MRHFNSLGASLRVPVLLAAVATLAQAGPWLPTGQRITNQSRQSLGLRANLVSSFNGMDLGFKFVSGSGVAPAGDPTSFPEIPIALPHGQTLELYYRFSEDRRVAASDLIAVTDAAGVSCGDLAVEVDFAGVTLAKAKVSTLELGLAESAPGVSSVALDGSTPGAIVFGAPAAAGDVESKDAPASASAMILDGEAKAPAKTFLIGEKPRQRVQCVLSLGKFGKELILTDKDGQTFTFAVDPVPAPHLPAPSDIPVDIIGDISGSMESPLAKDTERRGAVARSAAHERVYRAVRKRFPMGNNFVFDTSVAPWNLEGAMPQGGGTDLTTCLRTCRPGAITVIFTDDKGFVLPQEAFHQGCQKLIVPCLLTAFDIDVEFDTSLAETAPGQAAINSRYRLGGGTSSRNAPGFGAAMMGQRDGLPLIRIDTAYNDKGEVSDQADMCERIATAIEKARTAQFWRVTNPTRSEFVIHCPSGRSVCILPGTHTTVAPDLADLKGFSVSNVYVHTPKNKEAKDKR